jgi:hypothetical protein
MLVKEKSPKTYIYIIILHGARLEGAPIPIAGDALRQAFREPILSKDASKSTTLALAIYHRGIGDRFFRCLGIRATRPGDCPSTIVEKAMLAGPGAGSLGMIVGILIQRDHVM